MQFHQLFKPLAAQTVFCEQVCGINFTCHFPEIHSAQAHRLLDPKRMRVEMSEFPEALAIAYANGRARVGPDAETRLYSEVAEERLVPESLSSATNDTGELCLP